MIDASVILCVRNGASTIEAQLAALSAQSCPADWELVVVDNDSTDRTAAIAEQWVGRVPRLRVVSAPERHSLAYARNVGAADANGRVLAFCDADDVADRSWLEALLTGASEADIVGGRLELELLNSARVREWRGFSEEGLLRPRALGYLPYAVGANFAVRHETFDAVGGCDEAFVACSDDVDLSWRIQHSGGSIAFREDAVMHYRLRDHLREVVRQQHTYGRADALLRRKFRDRVPPARLREQWPTYRVVLTPSWRVLTDPGHRGEWLSKAAFCSGRLVGAAKYRVVHF